MKIAFILTAYERIDDLLAHLEILKFFPAPCEIIPIWMKILPEYFLQEMDKYPNSHYCDGIKFSIGPLLGLVSGMRKANELGVDYVIYRNGDDWLFNHNFVLDNLKVMDSGKDVAAYNWLSYNTMSEFALNEMYLRVKKFMKKIDEVESFFRTSRGDFLCELKVAKWIKKTLGNDQKAFYRLPDRELRPGVGFEVETFDEVFKCMNIRMPEGFIESLEDNQRFFNLKWQLIGSHNNLQRYSYYYKIRKSISYHKELEIQPHFYRWINCTINGKSWNLPSEKKPYRDISKPVLCFHKLPGRHIPKMLPKRRKLLWRK